MATLNKRCKCGKIIPIHIIQCGECKALKDKTYDTTKRDQDSKKFYNSKEWQRVRYKVLSVNPFCVVCERPAVVVDHIKEIKDGGAKLDISNLQPMCTRCHSIKTEEERKRRANG